MISRAIPSAPGSALRILFALLAYLAAEQFSLLVPAAAGLGTAIWPAAGIGVAVFLATPSSLWPILAPTSAFGAALLYVAAGSPLGAAVGSAAAGVVEILAAAYLLERMGRRQADTWRLRAALAVCAAALFPTQVTSVAFAALAHPGAGPAFLETWFSSWSAHALGILVLSPFALAWIEEGRGLRRATWLVLLESASFLALWTLLALAVFDPRGPWPPLLPYPKPYVLLVALAWPALRLSPRTLTTALVVLAALALSSPALRQGPSPLGGEDFAGRLLYVKFFLGTAAVTGLLLSASYAELATARRRAEEALARVEIIGRNIPGGLVFRLDRDREGEWKFVYLGAGSEELLGVPREAALADAEALLGLVHPADARLVDGLSEAVRSGQRAVRHRLRLRFPGGSFHWMHLTASITAEEEGSFALEGVLLDVSPHKAAEDELRRSEERFRSLLDSAGDGIFVYGPDGRFTDVNVAASALVGYSREEILERSLDSLAEPADLARAPAPLRLPGSEGSLRYERRFERKDGSIIDVEISAKGLADGTVIAIARDISARRWRERLTTLRLGIEETLADCGLEELVAAILREGALATASSEAFFLLVDSDGQPVADSIWVSEPGGGRLGGLPPVWRQAVDSLGPVFSGDLELLDTEDGLEELAPREWREMALPLASPSRIIAAIGAGGKTSSYRDEDVSRLRELGEICVDVIERKRIRSRLVETEARFAAIFRRSPVPTSFARVGTGAIVEVNDAFIAFSGYAREELIGADPAALGLHGPPPGTAALSVGEQPAVSYEAEVRRRDGRILETLMAVQVVHINGEHFLVTEIQDLTERKAQEAAVLKALAEKEALLRELYHRANNNMQIISALLDFHAETVGDDRLKRAIEDIQNRIGSLALVNRKLFEAEDLSHISLKAYIEDLVSILADSHASQGGRVRVEKDLEDVWVLIDSAIPCGLILNELISNVYRHAYPDGRDGFLRIELGKDPDGTIHLRVADGGVGLPDGFDPERDGRIGLRNIAGLCASQLRGRLRFSAGPGLACDLRFADNVYTARV